jgi:hypothetical protein
MDRYKHYKIKPQRYTRMWKIGEFLGWGAIFGLLFASMVLLWAGSAK